MRKICCFLFALSLFADEICRNNLKDWESAKKCAPDALKDGNKPTQAETDFSITSGIHVDLRNPTYKNGTLSTFEGGVIHGRDLRIQGRTIHYVRRDEMHQLEAEGDLLVQYKGRAYVGQRLEYDFITNQGTVYEGKTFSSMWYVGGDTIELMPDGSYKVKNAFITTCENKDSSWDLHASRVQVTKPDFFEAKQVRLRFFKLPFFWFPSLKLNLKKTSEPFLRYKINWDRGPLFGIRYQLYSWRDFSLYGRAEYRWSVGWGGALETEYTSPHKRTSFITRSYLGKDRLQNAPDPLRRYRLQGALSSISECGKTKALFTWDKYSDVRMPGDFKSEDFEVNTAKKTLLYLRHEKEGIVSLKMRPRLNAFESIQQELPTLYATPLPYPLGRSGILSSFSIKSSYLNFAYSDELASSLRDFHSARMEVREKLFRPLLLGPLTLTPYGGFFAILYSNSPSQHHKSLTLFSYGADLIARAQRNFSHYRHIFEPYARFSALTHPSISLDDHFLFSIQDGYHQIHQIQMGMKNLFLSKKRSCQEPLFTADLYANAFFSDPTIPQCIPKLYLKLDWRFPSLHFSLHNGWNFRHQLLDFCNARLLWTANEHVAFALEGRYRSRYDWRKADRDSFLLDVARSESELLLSPLSDRRIALKAHLFIRFNPFWECHLQSHHGLYRPDEKPYNEFKIDLLTWVSAACKIRFSLTKVEKGNKFRPSFGFQLFK